MGTYTTNLRLYKPDPTEFVDVETQLNDNWDISDDAVKKLFEYKYSNDSTPDTSNSVARQRYYKTYSNSLVNYFRGSNTWIQDSAAFVSSWVDISDLLQGGGGYSSHPTLKPAYRIIKKSGGTTTEIEWAGSMWLSESPMDLNINNPILTPGSLPVAIRPTVTKYFEVWSGNTTTDYSIARVLIGSDGSFQFKRYGVDPTVGSERRVDFTGIKYNVEVTG